MPDVLFVDEEGNPIEPGRENVIYVDENGSEIPEEVAVQLLESGKYVDSRELLKTVQKSNTISSGTNLAQSRASSQALHQAQMEAKMQAMALAEAQAHVFAKAQAELKQREEELASIEADAARGDTPISLRQKMTNSAKSISSVELQIQKSQSGRRLLQPPPKKIGTKSSENLDFSQDPELEALIQARRIAELREHEMLKEQLLERQRQIMEEQFQQRLSRQTEQSPYNQQQINENVVEQNFQVESKEFQTEPSFSSAAFVQHEQFNSTVHTDEVVDTHVSTTPVNLDEASSQNIKEYTNNFAIGKVKFVGYLTGDNVIRDISELSAEDTEKIYQEALKDQTPTQSTEEKKQDDLDPSIFGDELVEIDFGPIDAYTAALNAHLNAYKNASEVDDGKRFPAHVLTCSHATFIDNQLILGEAMYNTFETNNVVNGTSGINVELYQPDEEANQGLGKNSRTNTQVEYEHGNYSQSQSFASIIDIQSQRGYSIREMNQYQDSNFSKEDLKTNFDSYFDSIRSKQSSGGFYANTDNFNNNYVSR